MGLFRKTMAVGTLGMGVNYRSKQEKTERHRRQQNSHMKAELAELQYGNRLMAEQIALEKARSGEPQPEVRKSRLELWAEQLKARNEADTAARAKAAALVKEAKLKAKALRKAQRDAR